MANASISGLASGLDTATIISQLMQLERIPQNKLKTALSGQKNEVSGLQTLNSLLANLTTKVADLTKTAGWSPVTATSTSENVTVTTGSGTAAGSISFRVNNAAAAHQTMAASTAQLTDVVVDAGTEVTLTINGEAKTLDTGDGTLEGLVRALNGAGTGVRASTVATADGSHRLYVTSGATGAEAAFTLTNTDGTDLTIGQNVVTAGTDASITIGPDTVTSATNTFTGVLDGVSIVVSKNAVGEDVTIDLNADKAKVTDSVKAVVNQINEVLSYIDTNSADGKPLESNATARQVRNMLVNTIFGDGTTSMAAYGVELNRYGKFTFDAEKFSTAYADDPATVQAAFTDNAAGTRFFDQLHEVAKTVSDKFEGLVTRAIEGRNDAIRRTEDSIATWDRRLELRQKTLERQYAALETALSNMQAQGNWLAGQLAGLTAPSA